MKFKEIIDKAIWADVEEAMLRLYSDQSGNLEGYKVVLEELKDMRAGNGDGFEIEVTWYTDFTDSTQYIDVGAADVSKEPDDWERHTSIALEPWENWLGMGVDAQTLLTFTQAELVAACLWEMTFYGFEQEKIRSFSKELMEDYEDYVDGKKST